MTETQINWLFDVILSVILGYQIGMLSEKWKWLKKGKNLKTNKR